MADIDPGKQIELSVGESRLAVNYHEMGPVDGEPIVFVHTGGAAVSAWMCWHLTLPFFAEAGYHVIAPDSVGFGGTWLTSGPGVSNPTFLLALMDELRVERAHFIGNS